MSESPPPGGGGEFHLLESPPATDRAYRSSSAATPSSFDMQPASPSPPPQLHDSHLPYIAAAGDIQLTFHDGDLTDGKSEVRVEAAEDEEEDGLSIHNTLPGALPSSACSLPALMSSLSAELQLDPSVGDDNPAGSVLLFSYSQPSTPPEGVTSPPALDDAASPSYLASPIDDLPPPSPFSPLPLLPSIASPPVQSPEVLSPSFMSPVQSPTSAGLASYNFPPDPADRPHRYSIVVDGAHPPPPGLAALELKEDDGYDDEQPGSQPMSPPSVDPHALPPPSPVSHQQSLSGQSPQPHSASFSFSYQSDDSDDDDASPLPPPSVPPPPPDLSDRYDAIEPHNAAEAEALAALRRDVEEQKRDEEADEDDIGKVTHYHTVRSPEGADSMRFENNPLHVITIRSEEEQKAEERRAWELAVEQKRREKEERRARRAERRRRRAEREAQLQQQHTSSVLVIEEESAADVEEEEKEGVESKPAVPHSSAASRLVALAAAGSVVIDVSDDKQSTDGTTSKQARFADIPAADGKKSLRESRRPAKLNIPARSDAKAAFAAPAGSGSGGSNEPPPNDDKDGKQPAKGSLSTPAVRRTIADGIGAAGGKAAAAKARIDRFRTSQKQTLRQLVAVSWLPTAVSFPASSEQAQSLDKDGRPLVELAMPRVEESKERLALRRERSEQQGCLDKAAKEWTSAHAPDTRTEIADTRPHRFEVEERLAGGAQPSSGDGRGRSPSRERVVGRAAVLRIAQQRTAHLYHEVVLLDDGRAVDKPLLDALNAYTHCQQLTVNDTKVTHTNLTMPRLTSLTLSNNRIASTSTLTHLVAQLPSLSALSVINNPINAKLAVNALPPLDHDVWRHCILPSQSLQWWNGVRIDNPTRYAAYQCAKQTKLEGSVSLALFHSALDFEPAIKSMTAWTPSALVELRLSGMSLLALHCSPLSQCTNLRLLDVSHNHISTLQHSGLHLLPSLTSLDLSDNELHLASDCLLLAHLPNLLSLSLKNNDALKDSRLYTLYCTRYLKGTQCSPGLRTLDGEVLTREERVRAVEKYDRAEAGSERWRLLCCASLTHTEWINCPQHVTVLSFPKHELSYAAVHSMTQLLSVDLRHNALRYVEGLETCKRLRFVDVSHNAELNVKATLLQLASLTTLEHCHTLPAPTANFTEHYHRVLSALFPSNSRLSVVDGRQVDKADYVDALRRSASPAMDEDGLTGYRVNLSILATVASPAPKSFSVAAVQPGVQWQYDAVTELQLNGLALLETASLLPFRSLTLLSLSNNRLTSIAQLQLGELPQLLWLDVRINRIKDTPQAFGTALAACAQLRGVMVAGNPCFEHKKWRGRVMDQIPPLATVDCPLLLLDTPISVDERVTAFSNALLAGETPSLAPTPRHGKQPPAQLSRQSSQSIFTSSSSTTTAAKQLTDAQQMRCQQFRFLLSLQYALPKGASFHLVAELILVDQRLAYIDFAPFPKLAKLFLGRNELTSLKDSGLSGCLSLRVLDVRSNRLRDLAELIELVTALPALEYIGAKDNKWAGIPAAKYRNHLVLGLVSKLGHEHRIRFIDDSSIGADELVESLVETGEIANEKEKELFRFAELVKHKDASNLTQLDIGKSKLREAEFHRFPHLQHLHCSGNSFTDESLMASGLDRCLELEYVDLADNALRSVAKVATYLLLLPLLSSVNLQGNPLMSKEDRPRRTFLSYYPNLLDASFHLQRLNDEPVTIQERINAFVLAGTREKERNHDKGGRHRRTSSQGGSSIASLLSPISPSGARRSIEGGRDSISGLEAQSPSVMSPSPLMGYNSNAPLALLQPPYTDSHLALSNPLHFTAECARFTLTLATMVKPGEEDNQTVLRLKGLKLMYVGGVTGIARFKNIRQLDLRSNDMESLEHQGLDGLPMLHTLDLRGNRFQSLASIVGALHKCHQLEVLALQRSTRDLSETAVVDRYLDTVFTSLRGLTLCDGYKASSSLHSSPMSLSALNLLHKLAGIGPNELHEVHLTNLRAKRELLPYVLSALYHLQVPRVRLDGDNEWCAPAEYSDMVIILMGKHLQWFDGQTMSEERRYLALQVNEKKKLDKERLAWEDSWEEAHERVDAFCRVKHHHKAATLGAQQQGKFFNADLPQVMSVSAGVSSGASTGASLLSAGSSMMSSMLSKLEIAVSFLQVYAINLTIDINIPWPHLYVDFSAWTNLFTLSFTDIFSLSSDFAQTLLFSLLIAVPTVLLGFFYWLSRLRKHQDYYAHQLVNRWRQTAALAAIAYIASVAVAIVIGLFAAGDGLGLQAMEAGHIPPAESLTVAILLWASFTFLFAVWLGITHVFRKLYTGDSSEDKFVFRARWLSILNWSQIAVMFVLTILFMPIARILLSQFLCQCATDDATGDSTCSDQNYPDNDCFPHHISAVQALAFVFGLVYIIGLPLFYIRLINRTVKLVLSTSRVYQLNEEKMVAMATEWQAYTAAFAQDCKAWSAPQLKKKWSERKAASRAYHTTLSALRQQQRFIYYSVVNQPENVVPASSLYSSFTHRYRFWKIIQMAQKLLLIVISLFIPAVWGELAQAKVVSAGIVILATTTLVITARPYNDQLEDVMDAMAGVSNTINALVAIGLSYELGWLSSERSNIILLVANGATLLSFAVALVFVPLRAYRHAKLAKERERKEETAKEAERHEREERREKRDKERRDKERAEAMKSGKGAVGMVSAAEFERLQREQNQQHHSQQPSHHQPHQQQHGAKPQVRASHPIGMEVAAGKYPVASAAQVAAPLRRDRAGSLPRIDERSGVGLAADESLPAPLSAALVKELASPADSDPSPSPNPRQRHQRSSSVSISQLEPRTPPSQQRHSVHGGHSSVPQSPTQRRNSANQQREAAIRKHAQHAPHQLAVQQHARSNSSMDMTEVRQRSRSHQDEVSKSGHHRSVSDVKAVSGHRQSH